MRMFNKRIRAVAAGAAFLLMLVAAAPAPAVSAAGVGAEARWRREPSDGCATSSAEITLASGAIAETIGLELTQIGASPVSRSIERNVELAYNGHRYGKLSTRAPGVVAEVPRDVGEMVSKGDVLAVIDSMELAATKSDLLVAVETAKLWERNASRERAMVEQGVGVEREALAAETSAAEGRIAVNRARQRLRALGLSKEQVEAVERDGETSSLLALLAPFDGTIVERAAVVGELAEPGRALLAVADTGVMWAMVDLLEVDGAVVKTGQRVEVMLDGLPGRVFPGRLTWISAELDHRTRALRARVEVENEAGLLRANMFGRVRVFVGESEAAVLLPKGAAQWEGCCNIAFVRSEASEGTFRVARLRLSHDAGDYYEVSAGLSAGDEVVVGGSHILKNELLKDSVGAACCEVDHLAK